MLPSQTSVVRSADSDLNQEPDPSDKSLGYFHSSASRTASHCSAIRYPSASLLLDSFPTRPYNSVNPRNLSLIPSASAPALNRHAQFPSVLLGRFMRASVPRPSTSCKGTIAVFATDASTVRIKSQWISTPAELRYLSQNSLSRSICCASRVEPSPATLLNQPTAVSLSWVPV